MALPMKWGLLILVRAECSAMWLEKPSGVVPDETLNNQVGENWEIDMQGRTSCRKSGNLYANENEHNGGHYGYS